MANAPAEEDFDGMERENSMIRPTDENCDFQTVKEGRAEVIFNSGQSVFYNPVQEFNRDLSVAVLTLFSEEDSCPKKRKHRLKNEDQKGISVFEALAATGLRSIRYALEVPQIREIVANDWSSQAVESIDNNVKHNKVDNIVSTSQSDASMAMYMSKHQQKSFDVVDLDPYGCPSRFLDATVQVLNDGGLAMVTATDMAVLAGNSPETCYCKYGSVSLRSPACHEMALRILLQCIQAHANRYGRYIVPLMSVSADFYIRVFVRIFSSPAACKQSTSNLSHVFQCTFCKFLTLHPLGSMAKRDNKPPTYSIPRLPSMSSCPHCGHSYQVGGPVWSGPLHDVPFVEKLLSHVEKNFDKFGTAKRMIGMLSLIKDELTTPFYYTVDAVCSLVHCEAIPLIKFRSALANAGFKVSETHVAKNSVKTNAPVQVIWDMIRTWVLQGHPVSQKRLDDCPTVRRILETPCTTKINFEFNPEAVSEANSEKLVRFQVNPAPNWGPGMRNKNNAVRPVKCGQNEASQ
ncbi:N2,N2-dimethylguanosine tRNA methyltransferase [Nesidiocoris tenuis]|uniref:tRNA (guanine(26)-N(2))-dimethyltransferase n=1 Tax=Nesidiocoris tenuis TaxID=355587 RepID=A0ABN7BAY8_9HEMI|nr:N2,N2-dimethylguanosine tRNA methyltransferase [Nesidiocoris tenuis]